MPYNGPVDSGWSASSVAQAIAVTAKSIQYANDIKKVPKEVTEFAQEPSDILALLWRMRSWIEEVESHQDPWFTSVSTLGDRNGLLAKLKDSQEKIVEKWGRTGNFGKRILWPLE